MTKSISEMTADEKFTETVRLEWDVDSMRTGGKLREQFGNRFETFAAFRHEQRLLAARCLRQRGVTAEEERKYETEWRNSETLQEEFRDVHTYIAYRCAEERMLVGTGGR